MTPERLQHVKHTLHAALELAPEERASFLDEVCVGDAALRQEVESLIGAHEQTGRLVNKTTSEAIAELMVDGQELAAGQKISRYEIISLLGKGGMGEVYLARDIRLGRQVALKLLPSYFSRNDDRLRRFEQEARSASALNHPNIVTIYEFGEVDNRSFMATEFIEGETLRQRFTLHLTQPLSDNHSARARLSEALDVGGQVARALATAHAAGIIHRDIKPDNIMVRPDALVKVLDFGLAKLTERKPSGPDDSTRALIKTSTGVVVGTTTYMSPEQARGLPVDERTDTWSLGVVLYEMLAGRPPFLGPTTSDTLVAILERDPPPIEDYFAECPEELQRIVRKCLEKDRERRYQTVRDVALDLEQFGRKGERSASASDGPKAVPGATTASAHWAKRTRVLASALVSALMMLAIGLGYWWFRRGTSARSPSEIKSLAVLPFKSLSPEAKEEYLGLGLATDIITKISQEGGLTVRPTSAVRKYANQEMDALAAARELKVDAVLDSTFLHVGDQLRVSVNLLRVEDGASLWAQKFDDRFTDIFAIQDQVSQQVTQRLRLKLSPAGQARLAKRYTSNLEAYNYYANAMYHFYNIGPDLKTRPESDLAVELFKKAIELDPEYALAHAQLGYAYAKIAVFQEDSPDLIAQAKQELGVAERLDPQLAEVHDARYFIAFSQYEGWQVETAIRELRLAQQLDPNVGHSGLGDLYNHIGLETQAVEEFEMALKVDPNNDQIKNAYVTEYLISARPDEGLEARKRFFDRGPDLLYYLEKRMVKEAAPLVEQQNQQNPDSDITRTNRALLLALEGKHREAEAAVPAILEKLRRNRGYHHYTYNIARIYALGGNSEEAVKWLRVTVKEGFPCYPLFARDSFLDPLRKDPAFIQFLADMKMRWEGYQREFG